MGENARVVYLGLDAFDVRVATELIGQGELPTLQKLLEEGASVATEAPTGVFVSAQWPTFFTGLDPARHGYFCWKQFTPGTYDDRLTTPHMVDGRPFWETMSDAGKRVAIVDVPHTHAPEQLNGTMLVEWGCHDRHFGTHSLPESLVGELNERFGAHPIGTRPAPGFDQFAPCDYFHRDGAHRSVDEAAALWADIVEGHARKRAASLHLLDQGPWDLFMTVFGESHCTGHQLWSVHDGTHPWHSDESAERIGVDPLVEIYRRIDDTVAAHLAQLDPETTVYVNLSHGMGPHYDGTHVLDDVLRRLSEVDRGGMRSRAKGVAATALGVAHRRGRGAADGVLRRALSRPGTPPDQGPDPDPVGGGGDRAGRPWFAIPNNTVSGGIRLNVIGREPRGVLAAGADADTACERLRRGLLELVNVDTGEPVVTEVRRTDALYERSHDDALPDLFVEWNRNAPIERVWSPRIGLVERRSSHWRTGDHTSGGLLIATGPGIVPGRRPGSVPSVDLGVTLAAAAGVEIPDVDGVPVDFLLPSTTAVPGAPVPSVVDGAGASSRRAGVKRLVRAPAARARSNRSERAARKAEVRDRLASHAAHLGGQLEMLGDAHHMTRARTDIALTVAEEALRNAEAAERRAVEAIRQIERLAAIRAVTSWVENMTLPETTLVSVVMPTRNRSDLVPRAVASVLGQAYTHWELHIVDDGSDDDTRRLLASYADEPRIHTHRTTGIGAAGARNVGLDAAGGDVIVYLDDDNVFDPLWFKAVAWAFDQRPDVDVLYAARVIDDIDRVRRVGAGALPITHFEPWDRATLERGNIADMGVIAHRSKLPEGRFDPTLSAHADWDLFLRLTEERAPLELPVVALYYFSDSPDRISDGDISDQDRVREKLLLG